MEDEDETFVTVGNALEPYEEDEVPQKPVPYKEQTVKDDKGRQRFHGAFTGGFSAGYFNTVGSKEGWTPSSFVSSRGQKGDQRVSQRPEDFMDDEDLGEYGIAPRQVSTASDFTPANKERQQKRKAPFTSNSSIIPGEDPLQSLVRAAKITIGTRLLRKLGWKEGQGIGPRLKKGRKGGQKVYGCALPPGDDGDQSSSDEELPEDITFAPKDVNPISFTPKDDLHGIGYKGLDVQSHLGHVTLFEPPPIAKKGTRGFSGQAFGVGALEDDDQDIYAMDHMSNYDTELPALGETSISSGHRKDNQKRIGAREPSNTKSMERALEGFHLSSKPVNPKQVYPPPQLPPGFRPYHVTVSTADKIQQHVDQVTGATTEKETPKPPHRSKKNMDSSARAAIISETPEIKSVFDLVSNKDKEKLQQSKQTMGGPSNSSSTETAPATVLPSPSLSADTSSPTASSLGAKGFKPFARDPAKQARYEQYLQQGRHSQEAGPAGQSQLTEWEQEREREEFARAAALYKPLSSLMASRFTTAQQREDDDNTVEMPLDKGGDQSEQAKAAQMKMYGHLTRDRYKWHPDKVLCKRFNVPNPYPDSTIVGLPKVKRDKFSVFNFLGFPGTAAEKTDESSAKPEPEPIQSDTKKLGPKKAIKPLAILGTLDLRPKSSVTTTTPVSKVDTRETEPDEDAAPLSQQRIPEKADAQEKPSMDLFKAIFADSEDEDKSSESSTDSEENVTQDNPKPEEMLGLDQSNSSKTENNTSVQDKRFNLYAPQAETVHEHVFSQSAKQNTDSAHIAHNVGNSGSRVREEDAGETSQEMLAKEKEQEMSEDDDMYGPALPPILTSGSSDDSSRPSAPKKQKKKHKHKDKHKHKKKKAKSKKHKHSDKQKKKKSKKKKSSKDIVVISSTSGDSDRGSDSSNEKSLYLDAALLQRLGSLSQGARARAADFM